MSKHIIVMGVSGCGKSTVGELLLTDEDRQPWLEKLASVIKEGSSPSVTACSALKKRYRDTLRTAGDVVIVYLHGSHQLLLERLTEVLKKLFHNLLNLLLYHKL